MSINEEALKDAVEWVEWQDTLDFSKREWEQGEWFIDLEKYRKLNGVEYRFGENILNPEKTDCGTAKCVAGYIIEKHLPEGWSIKDHYGGLYTDSGGYEAVSTYAAGILGLDIYQAGSLFDGDNTAADIRRLAESFVGHAL